MSYQSNFRYTFLLPARGQVTVVPKLRPNGMRWEAVPNMRFVGPGLFRIARGGGRLAGIVGAVEVDETSLKWLGGLLRLTGADEFWNKGKAATEQDRGCFSRPRTGEELK